MTMFFLKCQRENINSNIEYEDPYESRWDKIKEMQQQREREHNEIITNLPTFESNFETLHKNYYKI